MIMLKTEVYEHIKAVFTGLWVKSFEHDDAYLELAEMCDERPNKDWVLCRWDVAHKLRGPDFLLTLPTVKQHELPPGRDDTSRPAERAFDSPQELFFSLPEVAQQLKENYSNCSSLILVLDNFHRLLNTALGTVYIQQIQQLIRDGKRGVRVPGVEGLIQFYLVVLSPDVSIPQELSRQLTVIDHKLPSRGQLWEIVEQVAEEEELPQGEQRSLVLEAAAGLTRMEAENAIALSLVKTNNPETRLGRVDPAIIWDVKSQSLRKSGLLELYEGSASFDDMGGIVEFRDFSTRLLTMSRGTDNPLLLPKGLLLLGVPGSGKSQAARCLATATNRRLFQMDVGSLMSKYVGDSDKNMREALEIVDAMSPCVLFIDEVEKALAGVGDGGDSGVSTRMFGQLLTWLNDHQTDVFTICTSNDISKLPPEFSRAERFDGIFFFDIPTAEERVAIWNIYLRLYGHSDVNMDALVKCSDGWTGAEIRACCRLAAILQDDLLAQSKNIVPVSKIADKTLKELRNWAAGRCRSVRQPGVYFPADKEKKIVTGDDSSNKKRRRTVKA